MHRPRFYALLRASSLTLTNLTTNQKKRSKHLQYIKLSSYAATVMFDIMVVVFWGLQNNNYCRIIVIFANI